MVVKRIAVCLLLLTLAGCYRQSEDSFAPSSLDSGSQPTQSAPTDSPPIIEPTLDTTPQGSVDETPTVMIIIPTESDAQPTTDTSSSSSADATATIVIFEQPTKAAPTEENLFSNVPTATPPEVITPILGNPVMVTLAAPTSTSISPSTSLVGGTDSGSDLDPTPTDLPLEMPGECDYTIVAGDTLFRISLREDITLEALLEANDLTESSIIQPGQVITIPDCVTEDETIVTTPTAQPDTFLPTPTGITTIGGTPGASGSTGATQLYKVQPGDTLSKIAAEFDVSVEAIVEANDLTNPNRLSIGQELKIPK